MLLFIFNISHFSRLFNTLYSCRFISLAIILIVPHSISLTIVVVITHICKCLHTEYLYSSTPIYPLQASFDSVRMHDKSVCVCVVKQTSHLATVCANGSSRSVGRLREGVIAGEGAGEDRARREGKGKEPACKNKCWQQ